MLMTLEGLINLAGLIVPQLDRLISRTRGYDLTIRVMSYVVHTACVPLHRVTKLALFIVPDLDTAILTSTHHIRVNWMHGNLGNSGFMPPQTVLLGLAWQTITY